MSDSTGPDALWAPWRIEYLESLDEEPISASEPGDGPDRPCFLRVCFENPADDEQNHVIVRTDMGLIMLNRYPYANGHLLVALGEGRPRLLDYEPSQRAALWSLTEVAVDLMERTLRCQGVNVGINQGRAGGAGVPEHLHVHVVPRWSGDVNFMTTVARVRVIPSALEAMAKRYRSVWAAMQD